MTEIFDFKGKQNQGPSPHIRTSKPTSAVMGHVIVALVPPLVAAVYFFGMYVLVQVAIAVVTAVLCEYLYQRLTYRKVTVRDGSAMVTGMLLGLSLPVTAPWWTAVIGSAFAIIVVKQWGGGLGRNIFNPALAARVMLKAFFSPWITNWVLPGPDAVATATPLEYLSGGARVVAAGVPGLWELFSGINLGGNVGETSKIAIIAGMLYLIFTRIINPKIPLLYIGSTMLAMGFYSSFNLDFMLAHALSGTLFFAAAYMATDYSSGCLTPGGKTVFAIGAGILTAFFRIVFYYPGGVGFAILIMNFLAPHIDQRLMPRIYGHEARPQVRFNRQGRG